MPLELGIWRIDQELTQISAVSLDLEERLESILDQDIKVASPNWMVIGRQVNTDYGKYIDLLAMDRDGNLVVLELKKDKTPREIVAQLLDYGSWIKDLKDNDIATIFEKYLKKYHPNNASQSLDDAFRQHFEVDQLPENLNSEQELVVVASSLDDSTERIVTYLSGQYGVPINAVFFRVFKDGDREYITRAWFIDPAEAEINVEDRPSKGIWNGEFYVSFGVGQDRTWEDAVKYGFISAGNGSWYSRTLGLLEPGNRIWVNVPGKGYVGVGSVLEPMIRVDQFKVKQDDGTQVLINQLPVSAPGMFHDQDDDEKAEYLVKVDWIETVPLDQAIKEKGFFGNQNTVAKPIAKSWSHTTERLKKRFGLQEQNKLG
jgi:hypothetical protein